MIAKSSRRWSGVLVGLVLLIGFATAEEREWTDSSGKNKLLAEFVAVDGDSVVLRNSEGKQIKVEIDRFSKQDQAFIRRHHLGDTSSEADSDNAKEEVRTTAIAFFAGLRGPDRTAAHAMLTESAQEIANKEKSPLAQLPAPAEGKKAIRAGKVRLEGTVAEIPVRVRADRKTHKTKLHLRYEGSRWQVFAISASYPDGEKSLNFEAEVAPQKRANTLDALLGNRIELAGHTLDGSPLDMSVYDGKVVLVDFWATWCGPCRAEIPNIRKNWDEYHEQGFEVIAISVDRDLNALQKFVVDAQPPWTILADNHPLNRQKMGAKYGIRGIPAFVLIGRDGKVAAVNCRGPRLGKQLDRLIRSGG